MGSYEVQTARSDELGLSLRERDVLPVLAEGLDTKQIALRLGISASTVRFHVCSLTRKLGVNGRAELCLRAAESGVIRRADGR